MLRDRKRGDSGGYVRDENAMNLILIAAAEGGLTISTTAALAIAGGAVTGITTLFALLMKSKEREYLRVVADLNESKENYEKLAAEALTFATQQANYSMAQANLPPIVLAAPVVPRSMSPSTVHQRETARLATMTATLAQLKLMMGATPRPTPIRGPQIESDMLRENKMEQMVNAPQALSPQVVVVPASKTSPAGIAAAIEAVPEKTAAKVVEKLEQKQP